MDFRVEGGVDKHCGVESHAPIAQALVAGIAVLRAGGGMPRLT